MRLITAQQGASKRMCIFLQIGMRLSEQLQHCRCRSLSAVLRQRTHSIAQQKRAQCGLGLTRWRQCPVQSWGCSAAVRGCGTWMQSWTRCKHMQPDWAFKRTVSTSLLKTVDSPCAQVGLYLCCSGHCSRRHLRYSRSCQSWQDLSVTLAARWGSRVCGKRVHITEAVTGSPTVATTGQAVRPGRSQYVVHQILCLVQLWQPLYSRGCAPRQTAHLSVCLGQTSKQ